MQVNITKRIDTPEGKRYCPVVIGPNGRIKPDWVMVNDRQEKHPEGAYYLDWNEDGKRRRVSVGNDAASAYNSRVRKQRELDATAAGLVVSNPIEDDSRLRIRSAVDDFLEEIQHKAEKNLAGVSRLPALPFGVLRQNLSRRA